MLVLGGICSSRMAAAGKLHLWTKRFHRVLQAGRIAAQGIFKLLKHPRCATVILTFVLVLFGAFLQLSLGCWIFLHAATARWAIRSCHRLLILQLTQRHSHQVLADTVCEKCCQHRPEDFRID